MCVSKNVAEYVMQKGINLSAISRATGISRSKLQNSISNSVEDDKRRPLRDGELLKICKFLGVNPMEFASSD